MVRATRQIFRPWESYNPSLCLCPEAPLGGFLSRPATYLMSKCTISLWWR